MVGISVIMATYNRASTIERAVKSVLNQTFKDFELVIIDDGSKDNTEVV
ncbi:MAG: glycosyltransferase family 2 protein, partial [Cetobacterium sp.]